MLDKNDLQAIRGVVQEVIQETVPEIVQEIVGQALEDIVLPKFVEIDSKFDQIDAHLKQHDDHFDSINSRLNRIEATMVTKDHLEDRLADFKSTLKQTGGKALQQIKKLTTELHRNSGLTAEQVMQVTAS